MKIIIEIKTTKDIDYEYFVDWLNDQIYQKSVCGITWDGVEASIISVDGQYKY